MKVYCCLNCLLNGVIKVIEPLNRAAPFVALSGWTLCCESVFNSLTLESGFVEISGQSCPSAKLASFFFFFNWVLTCLEFCLIFFKIKYNYWPFMKIIHTIKQLQWMGTRNIYFFKFGIFEKAIQLNPVFNFIFVTLFKYSLVYFTTMIWNINITCLKSLNNLKDLLNVSIIWRKC